MERERAVVDLVMFWNVTSPIHLLVSSINIILLVNHVYTVNVSKGYEKVRARVGSNCLAN